MLNHRFNEQEVRHLTLQEDALGWCQYEGEKPEHGYLILATLADGRVSALDRRGWQALRQPLSIPPTELTQGCSRPPRGTNNVG